jgi:hypothetical protein
MRARWASLGALTPRLGAPGWRAYPAVDVHKWRAVSAVTARMFRWIRFLADV